MTGKTEAPAPAQRCTTRAVATLRLIQEYLKDIAFSPPKADDAIQWVYEALHPRTANPARALVMAGDGHAAEAEFAEVIAEVATAYNNSLVRSPSANFYRAGLGNLAQANFALVENIRNKQDYEALVGLALKPSITRGGHEYRPQYSLLARELLRPGAKSITQAGKSTHIRLRCRDLPRPKDTTYPAKFEACLKPLDPSGKSTATDAQLTAYWLRSQATVQEARAAVACYPNPPPLQPQPTC